MRFLSLIGALAIIIAYVLGLPEILPNPIIWPLSLMPSASNSLKLVDGVSVLRSVPTPFTQMKARLAEAPTIWPLLLMAGANESKPRQDTSRHTSRRRRSATSVPPGIGST
jgi:hypothetical protein